MEPMRMPNQWEIDEVIIGEGAPMFPPGPNLTYSRQEGCMLPNSKAGFKALLEPELDMSLSSVVSHGKNKLFFIVSCPLASPDDLGRVPNVHHLTPLTDACFPWKANWCEVGYPAGDNQQSAVAMWQRPFSDLFITTVKTPNETLDPGFPSFADGVTWRNIAPQLSFLRPLYSILGGNLTIDVQIGGVPAYAALSTTIREAYNLLGLEPYVPSYVLKFPQPALGPLVARLMEVIRLTNENAEFEFKTVVLNQFTSARIPSELLNRADRSGTPHLFRCVRTPWVIVCVLRGHLKFTFPGAHVDGFYVAQGQAAWLPAHMWMAVTSEVLEASSTLTFFFQVATAERAPFMEEYR